MSPLWLLKYLPNMPASHLAIYNDFRGPNNSLTMREAAANAALGEAYQIILRGSADAMLVGATGTRLHPMKMIHAVQQEEVAAGDGDPAAASRPFDRDRRGMVLGEGAGAVVLEELSTAQARGATIYGEVVAAASSSVVGRRLVAKRDRAMDNVLRAAVARRGGDANDVGHLHAHGLSTRTCDTEEARAIARGLRRPLDAAAGRGREEPFRQPRRRQRHGRAHRQPAGLRSTAVSSRSSTTRRPTPNARLRPSATATLGPARVSST